MKAFESPIGPLFEDYISYRTGLGYSEKELRKVLLWFDRYLIEHHAMIADLSPRFFLDLKKKHHKRQSTFNVMLRTIRGFFTYLVRRQIVAENPLLDIPSYEPNAFIPFVFSREQTDALLRAVQEGIRKKDPDSFIRDYGTYMAIVLLARCGLRITEPLRLKLSDYHRSPKTLYIEKTKFRKDRLIPMPATAAKELDTYLGIRDAFVTSNNPYIFAAKNNGPLNKKTVYRIFDPSVRKIGINDERSVIGNTTFGRPTPHSLRHSFAINTLKAVKNRGGSPQNALPILSAYLGHAKYRYTAVYLKVIDAGHRKGLVDFAIRRQEEI